MKKLIGLVLSLISLTASADFKLSKSKKAIICYREDNVDITVNAAKTTMKFTQEGESNGARKIRKFTTDKKSYAIYETSEITLTLSDKGDTYKVNTDEEAYSIKCKD